MRFIPRGLRLDVFAADAPGFSDAEGGEVAGAEPVIDGAAADAQQVSHLFGGEEGRQWLGFGHAAGASTSRM